MSTLVRETNPKMNLVQIDHHGMYETDVWEAAYLRFETPEAETRKFAGRLIRFGASMWSKNADILELFCGRGNGLHALRRLGFSRVEGADISASLLSQYSGPGACYVCDCRYLPLENYSKDIVIIQGGLHHLVSLPADLEQCLSEINRVLRVGGRLVIVEPWLTPFLSFVHWVCRQHIARRFSNKIDALATMIHHERQTYEQWLSVPELILRLLGEYFHAEECDFRLGKLRFVGRKRLMGPTVS
jgi:ubiquinone/menaquinone biosynthesis C-methylase UbiE